jgi:excisionase family DNA binding protein
MKMEIPRAIATAAVGLLQPFCNGLSVDTLHSRLSFQPEKEIIDEMLSVSEAAYALGVSIPTVNRMFKEAQLRRVKIRGAVRVPRSAIDAVLNGSYEHEK